MRFMKRAFDKIDEKVVEFMKKIGVPSLRISLAIVFIWFGMSRTIHQSLWSVLGS